MNDERQERETVSDIMSEMREYADSMEKHLIYDLSECSTDYLRVLADRIEDAINRENRTVEKSSVVGNSAKMREALMEASIALSSATHHHMTEDDAKDCLAVIETAISAPPRNCDVFSKAKVLEILEDRSFSKEDTIEWIFSEAKGVAK